MSRSIADLERQAPEFFTVCISRETGARGRTVGNVVARKMGWTLYDQELLEYIARVDHARDDVLSALDPTQLQWLRAWQGAIVSEEVADEDYIKRLIEVVLAVAIRGKAVFVGRGAAFIVPRSRCVPVRVIGDRDRRISYLCQRERLSPEDASHYIDQTDRQRTDFVLHYFGKDPRDPHHYDMLLDPGTLGEELCGNLIVSAVHGKQEYLRYLSGRQTRPSPVPEA